MFQNPVLKPQVYISQTPEIRVIEFGYKNYDQEIPVTEMVINPNNQGERAIDT
jgi:hypothetical protein